MVQKNILLALVTVLALLGTSGSASEIAVAPNTGIWFRDGTTYGPAPSLGGDDATAIASIPGHYGYWAIKYDGTLWARGDAKLLCGPNEGDNLNACSNFDKKNTVESITAKPDGSGFWVLDNQGHVLTAGKATSYGDAHNRVGTGSSPREILATPSGNGYYIFFNDGHIYDFGDASDRKLDTAPKIAPRKYVSATLSYDASGAVIGYWALKGDGGVITVGKAPGLGSSPGHGRDDDYCNSITTLPYGRGYAWDCQNKKGPHLTYDVIWSKKFDRRQILPADQQDLSIAVLNESIDSNAPAVMDSSKDSETGANAWDFFPLDYRDEGNLRDGSVVQLVNVRSRMCLNISGSNYHEIIQWPCQSSEGTLTNDRWILRQIGKGNNWKILPFDGPDWRLIPSSLSIGAPLQLVLQEVDSTWMFRGPGNEP